MRNVATWLDCHITKAAPDLFGECVRTVQFRYVSVDGSWHFGRFGPTRHVENYSPFKSEKTWKTPPARRSRKVISACNFGGVVHHEYPSKIGTASAEVTERICWGCRRVLTGVVAELRESGPARQRMEKVERMLRFADEATQATLRRKAMNGEDEIASLVNYLEESGTAADYHAVCLAMALELEAVR